MKSRWHLTVIILFIILFLVIVVKSQTFKIYEISILSIFQCEKHNPPCGINTLWIYVES